jgi:hypothetical protein
MGLLFVPNAPPKFMYLRINSQCNTVGIWRLMGSVKVLKEPQPPL